MISPPDPAVPLTRRDPSPGLAEGLRLCGILAPLLYVATVALGGALYPGYSHRAQPVSDLVAAGAVNKALLDPLFALYNLLTLAFAWGLFRRVGIAPYRAGSRWGRAVAFCLAAEALFGLLTLAFPESPGGLAPTLGGTGALHVVFAGLSSVATMLTLWLVGLWVRSRPRLRLLALYSFVSVLAVLLSGGAAAVAVAHGSPIGGLLERITIGGYLQWLFVLAWSLGSAGHLDPFAPFDRFEPGG